MQVFAELPSLGFVKCASLIGHNNSQEMRTCQMQDTIAKFRDGRVCSNSVPANWIDRQNHQIIDAHSSEMFLLFCFLFFTGNIVGCH